MLFLTFVFLLIVSHQFVAVKNRTTEKTRAKLLGKRVIWREFPQILVREKKKKSRDGVRRAQEDGHVGQQQRAGGSLGEGGLDSGGTLL
jgi:hypothetical protein